MNASGLRWLALAFVTLAAARPALAYTITVSSRAASFGGTGTVTDVPAVDGDGNPTALWQSFADPAITCVTGSSANCVANAVDGGAPVILRATPGPGSALASWVGCSSTSTTLDIGGTVTPTTLTGHFCRVSTTAAKYVTAYFRPTQYTVTVKPGPGSVAVGPGGAIGTCAHPAVSCNFTVPAGTLLELSASPVAPPAWEFSHWAGCTSAAPTCSTVVNGWKTIAAHYRPSQFSVGVSVTGGGLVQGDGVWCPGDCTGSVVRGGSLVLEAVPYPGSEFLTWFGCPSAAGTTCTLENAQSNRSVQAYFREEGCVSCHQNPPSSHGPNVTAETDCATCHGAGFGTASVGPGHNDGRGTLAADVRSTSVPKPDEALTFEILSVDATPGRVTSVTYVQKDKAGNRITSPGTFTQIVLARLRDEGTYRSYYSNVRQGASYVRDGVTVAPALASASQDSFAPGGSSTTPTAGNPPGNFRLNADQSWTYLFPDCSGGCYTAAGQTAPSVFGSAAVPVGEADNLHTVSVWGHRAYSSYTFVGHASHDFTPDNTPAVREVVSQEACDRCHGELEAHNQRRGIKVCLGCHNPDTVDPETGNDVDMASMVHKIHNGAQLANDYTIVGYQQAVFEYNHVRMGPSHTRFFLGTGPFLAAQGPHPPSAECGLCHDPATAEHAANAYTHMSRRACGSCHDAVDFVGGTNHAVADDTTCGSCHSPPEVERKHSPLYEAQLDHDFTSPDQTFPPVPPQGYDFDAKLVSVHTDAFTNQLVWTVDFRLDGAPFSVNPMPFPNTDLVPCQFVLAGPTSDYTVPSNGAPAAFCSNQFAWVPAGAPGRFTYRTPNWFNTVPVKPDGYYTATFFMALRRRVSAGPDFIGKPFAPDPNALTVRNVSGTVHVVTDPVELAVRSRRQVVDYDKCDRCHIDLGYHAAASRKDPACAMCHSGKLDNAIRVRARVDEARPASTFDPAFGPDAVFLPESMSMNVYIHRIHMGSRLPSISLVDYDGGAPATASRWVQKQGRIAIGATRSNVVGFSMADPPLTRDHSAFAMPNPMNRCDQCHVADGARLTWALPEAAELAPTERTLRACTPATSATVGAWGTPADWCDVVAGIVEIGEPGVLAQSPPYVPPSGSAAIITPPMKAVCTSCHDSAATDAHADAFTGNPMTEGAVEYCATCHGAGRVLDSLLVHRPVP